jgi:hypothetical protein
MLTAGKALTVTVPVVLLHPVAVAVKVNVDVPAVNPVTVPPTVTDAIAGLLLTHVPPVAGDNVVVPPTHIELLPVILTVGKALTVKVKVSMSATHGAPSGLSVVKVMVTVLPASVASGVYVKLNGELLTEVGETDPAPFSVIVTVFALVNVLPLIVTGASTQVELLELLRLRVGGLIHAVVPERYATAVPLPLKSPEKVGGS